MFAQIVISLIISAIAYALSPKPKVTSPVAGSLDVPMPQLGQPVSVVFGQCWLKGAAVSYYGNALTTPIKAEGGK